jgi:hypothetical protein
MSMKMLSVVFCLFLMLCSSCNEINPKGEDEIRAFVMEWSDKHTELKFPYLDTSYMDVVQYYGKEQTRYQVQKDKALLFEQFPDYGQQILNNEFTISKEGASYLVVFVKEVTYDGVEAAYETYLLVTLFNSKFIILREGVSGDKKYLDVPIFPNYREQLLSASENRQLFGDFNGDDLSDYAYVVSPKLIGDVVENSPSQTTQKCKGACKSVLRFSAPGLEAITITDSYNSQLENLKDLNSDGADEIGYWDLKPTFKTLYVFDATTGGLLTPPVIINTTVHKDLKLIDVFKKTGPNKITVTRSVEQNGKWILVSEIVVLD